MAKTSDANSKLYSRYSKEIYMCAKSGGSDADANLALRSLLDRAKKDQVPAHVIDKAIKKADGGGGEDFETVRYEGFGPGGCMVIVECLTDNTNRSYGDVRTCFNKAKAKIGTQGTVMHSFDHCAIFSFTGDDEETVLEALMEADVDVTDIECEDGKVTVFAPNTEYGNARQALKESFDGIELDVDEIQFVPQNTAPITGEDAEMMDKFLALLNDVDDVQNIYHNAEY